MGLKFLSLASGSSGNCYYLGTDEYGILIDAGISMRRIKKILTNNNIELSQILAVFITHDHTDHIKSAGNLGEKHSIPVYATQKVHAGMNSSRYINTELTFSRRIIEKEEPVYIRDFKVTAFAIPHDASDCVGYSVDYNRWKWVLATDVGHIDDTVGSYIRIASHLVVEANYDREMLYSGHYSDFLKNRISNGTGHLCNTEIADFLAANFDLHLKNIWLCHLSHENNHPDLAYEAVETAMGAYGIRIGKDVHLNVLKRSAPSEVFLLE
jgi:phosphoribosyl 1,2-cyclic phosphodiesterase